MSSTIYRRPCPAPDAQCERYGTCFLSVLWAKHQLLSGSCWAALVIIPFNQSRHQVVYTMNAKEEHRKDLNSNSWQGRRNHLSRKWVKLGPYDVFIQPIAFSQRRGCWVIVPDLNS